MASTSTADAAVMPAPSAYVVDFDNPEKRTGAIIAIYIIWTAGLLLSCASVVQRVYVKVCIRNRFGFDDVLLLAGFFTNLACQLIILLEVVNGEIGVHLWEITVHKYIQYALSAQFLDPVLYAFPPWFCKIVVLMFFLEIGNVSRPFRWSVFFTMFVVTGSGISTLFYSIFQCIPIRAAWDIEVSGVCINRVASYKATAILGVITDAMIIAIPVPMVMGLKMSWRKKLGLMGLFGLGSLTLTTSIVRLILLIQLLSESDVTWNTIVIDAWIVVEGYLLVICASASTFRLFLRDVAPGMFSTTQPTLSDPPNYKQGIVTVGSSGNPRSKRRYSRFDDLNGPMGLEMDQFDVQVSAGYRGSAALAFGRESGLTQRSKSPEDTGIDKFIIQKTTEVHIVTS